MYPNKVVMKKFTLILFLLIGLHSYGQNWTKITLATTLSIDFPSIPQIDTNDEIRIYFVSDSTFAVAAVLLKNPVNMNEIIKGSGLDEYYEGMTAGTLAATKNSVLLKSSSITLEDFPGCEIIFTGDLGEMTDVFSISRYFVIGDLTYTFTFRNFDEQVQNDLSRKFFNSVQLIK